MLALCGLCMAGLSILALIRLLLDDFTIALIEASGFVLTGLIFLHVFRTNRIEGPGLLLSLAALSGTIAIIYLGGPDERSLLYPTTVVTFFLARPYSALAITSIATLLASGILFPVMEFFEFCKFLISITGCILFACIFARERNFQRDKLLRQSTHDPLTGVGNRRAFDKKLEEIIRIHKRTPSNVVMLMIDLDDFKTINDTEGHSVGDEALKMVANTIKARLRAGDTLYRYGGDEFVIIAAADIRTATGLAENLRSLMLNVNSPARRGITLSIGVTQHLMSEGEIDWLRRTDRALFEAKRAGKNQVHLGVSVTAAH